MRTVELASQPMANGSNHKEVTQSGLSLNVPEESIDIQTISIKSSWTPGELREVMWCFEFCKKYTSADYKTVFKLWRERNPLVKSHIDGKTLSNQRRNIADNCRVSESELTNIRNEIQQAAGNRSFRGNIESNDEPTNEDGNQNGGIDANEIEIVEEIEVSVEMNWNSNDQELERNLANQLKNEIFIKYYEVRLISISERERLPKIANKCKVKSLLKMANQSLSELLSETGFEDTDITELNHLIYATASVITDKVNEPNRKMGNKRGKAEYEPAWKFRIGKQIEALRKDTSILVEIRRGNMHRKHKKAKDILRAYRIDSQEKLDQEIEILKQKISAKTQRINRYTKRVQQFKQNQMYNTDRKKLFRQLREKKIEKYEPPSKEEVEEFWRELYQKEVSYNKEACWLNSLENCTSTMEWSDISEAEIKLNVTNAANWKSPGIDKIQNFWLKNLYSVHEKMAELYNKIINYARNNENNINKSKCLPDWLTEGVTYLLPKNDDTKQAKNYRPITCLPTIYKIFTSILAQRLSNYIHKYNIIPREQKGCCKDSYGCKDQLLVSKIIMDDCRSRKTYLAQGWIDYQKAYDSVPHDWILESMKRIGIPNSLTKVCEMMMMQWRTNLILTNEKENIVIKNIKIKRGIFQGDSLSPMLFCISLIPLTHLINSKKIGYRVKGTRELISHLLYMDDLKLICKTEEELEEGMRIVKQFSDDIRMNFGLDKCAVINIKSGKRIQTRNIDLGDDVEIKSLEVGKGYKYLGIEEHVDIDHTGMKRKLIQEYKTRIRAILRTELSGKNKIDAIGSLATPVMQYSFGIINWKIEEIRELDRKTRKILTLHRQMSPLADVDRLYVNRKEGGRGLQQLEMLYKTTIVNTAQYLLEKAEKDPLIKIVKDYDDQLAWQRSLSFKSRKFLEQLAISNDYAATEGTVGKKLLVKAKLKEALKSKWREKPMHGQFLRDIESIPVDKYQSFIWLSTGNLKGETESLLTATQDQAIKTRYYANKILGDEISSICRFCQKGNETVEHVVAGCSMLAKSDYIERHDNVARQLHYNICQELAIPTCDRWYQHKPNSVAVTPDEQYTVMWNEQVHTDRTIRQNRPDIILKPKNGTCLFIEVSVPTDRNIISKEAEKILKYRDLTVETQRMWGRKVKTVPVIIGATGIVSKNFVKYLEDIPGKHNARELQKTAVLGTARIVRKLLM